MGVLNVTPDSFSDGGRWSDGIAAVERGRELAVRGADIVDVGGESSRPGAKPVSVEEELARVLPVVEQLARDDIVVSVDTCKPEVAAKSLEAGAQIINDITGLDEAMLELLARYEATGVAMHMQGEPRTMQASPTYDDVVAEVLEYLAQRVESAREVGVDVIVDPGIGFGKSYEHNLALLERLDEFQSLGVPVLVGVSRKSFLKRLTGREVDERLAGTLACNALSVLRGADILRVHDVAEHRDLVAVLSALGAIDPKHRTAGSPESRSNGVRRAGIEITGIDVDAHVGVPAEERARPQTVRVSLSADVILADESSDTLEETADYAALIDCVRTVTRSRPRRLLETLAADLCERLQQDFPLANVTVSVAKPEIERALGVGSLEVSRSAEP